MSGAWTFARIAGIPLRLHWTFWLLPAWVLGTQLAWTGIATGLFHLAIVLTMFGCVVLHELGHALAARRFGIGTRDIVLYPIGGVASLDRISEKPHEELLIALAGPAVNVAIFLLLFPALLFGAALAPAFTQTWSGQFLLVLMVLNVVMVVFNLIPAFPLDGGRVFRALLAWPLGHLRATRIAAMVGSVLALFMAAGGVFFLGNPFLLVIGLFVFLAGQRERAAAEMRARFAGAGPFSPFFFEETESPAPYPRSSSTVYLVWDPTEKRWLMRSQ